MFNSSLVLTVWFELTSGWLRKAAASAVLGSLRLVVVNFWCSSEVKQVVDAAADDECPSALFQLILTRLRGGPMGGICWVASARNASLIRCGCVVTMFFQPTVSITSVAWLLHIRKWKVFVSFKEFKVRYKCNVRIYEIDSLRLKLIGAMQVC